MSEKKRKRGGKINKKISIISCLRYKNFAAKLANGDRGRRKRTNRCIMVKRNREGIYIGLQMKREAHGLSRTWKSRVVTIATRKPVKYCLGTATKRWEKQRWKRRKGKDEAKQRNRMKKGWEEDEEKHEVEESKKKKKRG